MKKLTMSIVLSTLILTGCAEATKKQEVSQPPVLSASSSTETVESSVNADTQHQKAVNAVIAMNYMHGSLNKIVMYNDKIVLDQEYNTIINNINLRKIEDVEVVDLITYLMDTLTYYKLTDMEKGQLQATYQKKLDGALTDSLMSLDFSGSSPQEMLVNGVMSAGSAYFDYKKRQQAYKDELKKANFALEKDTISELNEIRKDFLKTYWEIMKRYDMPDEWRITERQFTRFIEVLKGTDEEKKYRQLKRMDTELSVLPDYWYQLALTAKAIGDSKGEKSAITKYESVNNGLLRHNSDYSLLLVNKTAFMDINDDEDELYKTLEKIYKVDPLNPNRKLFLALKYQELGKYKKAESLLNENIDDDFLPVLSQRLKIEMYMKKDETDRYETTIETLIGQQNIEANEFLYYLGKYPLPLLVEQTKANIEAIKIDAERTIYGNDDIYVYTPKQWVISDVKDTDIKLIIGDSNNTFTEISKENDEVKYYYKDAINYYDFMRGKYKTLTLDFEYKRVPMKVEYDVIVDYGDMTGVEYAKKLDTLNAKERELIKKHIYDGIDVNSTTKSQEELLLYANTHLQFTPSKVYAQDKCFDFKNDLTVCK